MKRYDYAFGRIGRTFGELSIYQDIGESRLGEHGWQTELDDAVQDLLSSLQAMYGVVELRLNRIVEVPEEISISEV